VDIQRQDGFEPERIRRRPRDGDHCPGWLRSCQTHLFRW
jgi:hypothetical protein